MTHATPAQLLARADADERTASDLAAVGMDRSARNLRDRAANLRQLAAEAQAWQRRAA